MVQLSQGRILGHPVHAILVHFPAALWPLSFVLDAAGVVMSQSVLSSAAFTCLAVGVLGGSAAAIFGAIDFFRLAPDHPAWKTAAWHGLLNFVWLTVFAVLFGLKFESYPNFAPVPIWQLIVSGSSVLGLLFSNYLGGELVFRHQVGVTEEKPNSEGLTG